MDHIQPAHPLAAAVHADQGQLCVHPPPAIGAAGAVADGGDRLAQLGLGYLARRGRPVAKA